VKLQNSCHWQDKELEQQCIQLLVLLMKPYAITGPEALSYYQVAEILSNATGKKIDYVTVSEEDTRLGMKDMGWDDWLINTTLQLFDLYRKGYASEVSSTIEEVLGRNPISFSQFVKDHAWAFR
jgi:hypothetical protein